MKSVILVLPVVLLLAISSFSQDPLPVTKSSWTPTLQRAQKVDVPEGGPARLMTVDDTNFERNARAIRTDHPDNPSDLTPDGRRAAIEKAEADAKVKQPADVKGFLYSATVRNEGAKTVKVVFWEYRFTELANPANVGRRQFLCAIDLKKGGEAELTAFSTIGPTDALTAESLSSAHDDRFDGKVRVNRIEYADGEVLQRGDWKLADNKAAIERATKGQWGKEMCRPL